MRIAFVSYECAGVGEGGGIGTYVRQAASMMAKRGHDVVVFTGQSSAVLQQEDLVQIVNLSCSREQFALSVVAPFTAAHARAPFDVVEGAEFGADTRFIVRALPEVARVIKLHTASYQIGKFNDAYRSPLSKVRFVVGALRRMQWPRPYWGKYNAEDDAECIAALSSDEVTSPSNALLELARRDWPLEADRCVVIPHPFVPGAGLASQPSVREGATVTFIGRLEVRKGVLDLAKAIPKVLRACPSAKFRFVGRSLPHPSTGEPLDKVIRQLCGAAGSEAVEFTGAIPYSKVGQALREATLVVVPSYWEAFGFVCLEAMASGCAVIGSSAGGMAEIITHGENGLLVPPRSPSVLAAAILELLDDGERRNRIALAARSTVLTKYAPDRIAPLQEASYARAMARARVRNAMSLEPSAGATS